MLAVKHVKPQTVHAAGVVYAKCVEVSLGSVGGPGALNGCEWMVFCTISLVTCHPTLEQNTRSFCTLRKHRNHLTFRVVSMNQGNDPRSNLMMEFSVNQN